MALLEWNCYFNNDAICVTITSNNGMEPKLTIHGDVDANTHAAIHCLSEVARCLAQGISIPHYFNPTLGQQEVEVLVKCQWMRSGKLFCAGDTSKKYHHCTTVEQAMMQRRVFTCTRSLYNLIPKRRPPTKVARRSSVPAGSKPAINESEATNGSSQTAES